MRKFLSVMLVLCVIFSFAIPCFASPVGGAQWEGFNVSPVSPLDSISPLGVNPPTKGHNCHAEGILPFHGTANWDRLWLNKNIYGCNAYGVYIYNRSDKPLTFIVRGISGGDKRMTLPGKCDTANYFNGLTFRMPSRNDLFCISFEAPSNFEGWVCCAD